MYENEQDYDTKHIAHILPAKRIIEAMSNGILTISSFVHIDRNDLWSEDVAGKPISEWIIEKRANEDDVFQGERNLYGMVQGVPVVESKDFLYAVDDVVFIQEEHRPISWDFDSGEIKIEYKDGETIIKEGFPEDLGYNNHCIFDTYTHQIVDELEDRGTKKIRRGDDGWNEYFCYVDEYFDLRLPEDRPLWRKPEVMHIWESRLYFVITSIVLSSDKILAETSKQEVFIHLKKISKP